jgi:hypothetical protein
LWTLGAHLDAAEPRRGTIMRSEFAVLEPLVLRSARRFGTHVRLVVRYRASRRRIIWFHFATESAAQSHGARLASWISEKTDLAFVRGPVESVLLDMRSLLARAA